MRYHKSFDGVSCFLGEACATISAACCRVKTVRQRKKKPKRISHVVLRRITRLVRWPRRLHENPFRLLLRELKKELLNSLNFFHYVDHLWVELEYSWYSPGWLSYDESSSMYWYEKWKKRDNSRTRVISLSRRIMLCSDFTAHTFGAC